MNTTETIRDIVDIVSPWIIPLLIVFFPLYGLLRRVPVYESFVEGAKEGFTTAVRIIPYLVAILFAIGMFRSSGAMAQLTDWLRPAMSALGVPPEILPMAIVRPLTGGGSIGVLGDTVRAYGTDSLITRISATIFASTETTFYVIAVYFGAVNIKRTRHALPAGLIADFAAIILAVYVVKWMLG